MLWIKAGGYQDSPSKNFCLKVPKNFIGGPFCAVFQKISGSEKNYGTGGGGEYQDFPSKEFCLTVPKNFVEEPDCVSENFGSRKTLCLGGEYHDFLLKICCLTIPKNFVGEPFFVSQKLWYRKNLWIRRGGGVVSRFSVKKFFSHCRKIS